MKTIATNNSLVHGEMVAVAPTTKGRLSLLTFAVKELCDVKGFVTGAGNLHWKNTHHVAHAAEGQAHRRSEGVAAQHDAAHLHRQLRGCRKSQCRCWNIVAAPWEYLCWAHEARMSSFWPRPGFLVQIISGALWTRYTAPSAGAAILRSCHATSSVLRAWFYPQGVFSLSSWSALSRCAVWE